MLAVFYESKSICLINKEINTCRQLQSAKTSIMHTRNMVKKQNKHIIPSDINTSQCFPVAAAITFGKQNKV